MAPERERRRYFVALVLTGRVAAEVDGLRRALQPELVERLPPHVTLVPPVNAPAAVAESAATLVARVAATVAPLTLALGPLGTFLPRTPVVYLACADPDGALAALAADLTHPPLAAPPDRPHRDFVPHVTLTNAVAPDRAPAVVSALQGFRALAPVGALSLLEQERGGAHAWQVVAEFALGGRSIVGRGGLPLELTVEGRLEPEAERFALAAGERHRAAVYGPALPPDEPVSVVARQEGVVVGVATAVRRGAVLDLEQLVVAEERRRQGIGGRILAHLERRAREQHATMLRVLVPADDPAAAFSGAHGFAPVATLPQWRHGRDFVVFVRRLDDRERA